MQDGDDDVTEIVVELEGEDAHAVAVQEMMARVTMELSETMADQGTELAIADVQVAAELFTRYLQSTPLPPDMPDAISNLVTRWIAALDTLIEEQTPSQ